MDTRQVRAESWVRRHRGYDGLSTEQHPNSKNSLGGSKSYTGGTAAREFRRRRIWQNIALGMQTTRELVA